MAEVIKLNPTRKQQWLTALRSGLYQQTDRRLTDGCGGYCCYGVACEISGTARNTENVPITWTNNRVYYGEPTEQRWDNIPLSVAKWLGIGESYRDGRIYIPVYDTDPLDLRKLCSLADTVALDYLNDDIDLDGNHRFPFNRIADLIEERL